MNTNNYYEPAKNADGKFIDEEGKIITFRFLRVEVREQTVGIGFDPAPAICPHCGAEGKYVYVWVENGEERAAMSGCYKKLTGKVSLGEKDSYLAKLAIKRVRGESLNSWDKTIIRMLDFKAQGKYSPAWCDSVINKTLSERSVFLSKNNYK